MQVITTNELIKAGGIYITNVIEGTNQYPYSAKKCTEEEAISWILTLAKEHGVYADFYARRINEESLIILKERLTEEEMGKLYCLLEKCKKYKEEFILFTPTIEELCLLVKLSYRELLFSTFYMTDPQVTIWSNYEGEFIVFAAQKSSLAEII